MCNNILELAGNPSTAFTETELSPDPQYNFEDTLPDWLLNRRKRQQKLAEVLKWYQDLHWGWKLGIGIGLLIGAITFTVLSGGGWLGVLSVVAQVAIGVGVAVGLYSLGALFGFYDFSLEGLGNVALDAFLASSAIAFVSSSVGFIKHLTRSRSVSTAELAKNTNATLVENIPVKELNHTNGLGMTKGEFEKLVLDIKANGIQSPIKYKKINGIKYIIDGNHRVMAAKLLHIKSIPAQAVNLPYLGYSTVEEVLWDAANYISFWR